MAITAEQLNVILSARDRDFQKRMKNAEKRVQYFKDKSNRNLSSVSRSFDSLGAVVRRLGPILAAAFSVQAITNMVRSASEIGKLASVAGTGVVEFQKFAAGARTVGIEMSKASDIIKDVNDKVGDFIATGGGPMKDFFENIAPQVGVTADQFARLSGPQALQLYVDSLERANLSQSEMTFYMEAIANDATALLPVMRGNGREMRKFGDEAQRAGRILDQDAIDAARDLEIEAGDLASTISTQLTKAILENKEELMAVVSFITDTAIPAFANLISAIGEAAEIYDLVANRTIPSDAPILSMPGAEAPGSAPKMTDDQARKLYGPDTIPRLADTGPTATVAGTSTTSGGGSGGGRSGSAGQSVDDLREKYRDLIGVLDAAVGIQNDYNDAQRMLNEALATGAINQQEFNVGIAAAKQRLADATFEASNLSSVMDAVKSGMDSAFMSMIDGTGSAKDAFKSMARDIISELYRVLVVQRLVGSFSSGGGGILGSLFGSFGGAPVTGNAAGGTVSAGVPSITGEHGRELFVPQVNGRVMTTAQTKQMMGGGNGVTVVQNNTFGNGVNRAEINAMLPRIVETTKAAVFDAQRRSVNGKGY